jgi:cytochrome c oxidase subunit 2
VRRGPIVQLILFAIVAAAAGLTLALVPGWLPRSASHEADRINFVFWFVTIICIVIFAAVAAILAYAVLKFRARPDDDSDGPPIHGHTGLEILWTAIPTALVTAIAIVSAIVLARNDAAGAAPLRVDVLAQQFAWNFKYPSLGNRPSGYLRLPVGRSVVLHMRAPEGDVIHSFFVPEFGQKQDIVPGIETTLHITPKRVGTFPLECTELCGLGHALMRSQAIVMSVKDFQRWAQSGGGAAAGAPPPPGGTTTGGGGAALGKQLFDSQSCNGCHTLTAAGAKGTVGPDLDKLPAFAQKAGKPLEEFVRQSIIDPGAYVEPGFPKGVMPSFKSLPPDQLSALVQYLVASSRGSK